MMKLKIQEASSISCQNSFNNDDPFANMHKAEADSATKHPIYMEYIPPLKLRRLSSILRMTLTTTLNCISNHKSIDGMIYTTALGCLNDTEKFLVEINNNIGKALSPTAFIQSTHNTISGQISLFLKNHSYNMTHSQLNLSFETGLMDCINGFCSDSNKKFMLLGAADEKIDCLDLLRPMLISSDYPLTELSSTFLIAPENELAQGDVFIDRVITNYSSKSILEVLTENNLKLEDFDLVLHSNVKSINEISGVEELNYLEYFGINYSSNALATHFAFDFLKKTEAKKVLVLNNICPSSTGIICLGKIE